MSPFQIKLCLHYHVCPADDFENNTQRKSPIFHDEAKLLMEAGMLVEDGDVDTGIITSIAYKPTEKLHAYCRALGEVPLPECKWVNPQTGKIIE